MILVDTSVWIEHVRSRNQQLAALLNDGCVLGHPWVIGELALGSLAGRSQIIGLLRNLPEAPLATDAEVLKLIDDRHLFGVGIGYVDAHLLASTLLAGARLWTRDKKLSAVAEECGVRAAARARF
jgi:predicted nucleic acid-binding protein